MTVTDHSGGTSYSDRLQLLHSTLNRVHPIQSECWDEITRLLSVHSYEKNHYFAEAGELVYTMGFVVEGIFRAFHRGPDGDEYNKTFFMPGTFVAPLTALVRGKRNQINLQALTPSSLLVFPYDRFVALYDRYPELERISRIIIEQEWAKKEEREIALVTQSASERYQTFLAEHPGLEDLIPLYHIASYLGITPIHLSRIRAEITDS